jgi:glutamine amidotransferase
MKVTVLNYGMGNLRSVQRALESTGATVEVTDRPDLVRTAEKIVLPGVGAFGEACRRLRSSGLWDVIIEKAASGTPLLGICLGMQLLFEGSEEDASESGLSILSGRICRFDHDSVKVPHIGWNIVQSAATNGMFSKYLDQQTFYFVHSFYLPESPWGVGHTEYGKRFVSAVQHENVLGVQFHPEKSQDAGLQLLSAFVKW